MTTPLTRLRKRRVLAAKLEAAVGGVETLTAAEAVFNVFDAEMQAGAEFHERPGQAGFSPLPGVVGARVGTCTFAIELYGSGTKESTGGESVPAWAKVFLPACGLIQAGATSPIFNVSSTGPAGGSTPLAVRSLTIGLYEDGMLKLLTGAMGNAAIRCVNGQPVRIEFTFTGVWNPPANDGLLTPTYPKVLPPRFGGGAITLTTGWSPVLGELSFDLGNQVQMRADATKAAGLISAIITGRRVTGSMNPESSLTGERNSYGIWLASTPSALSVAIGAGDDGNSCTLAAPALQITNPQEIDRDGIQADELAFQCNRSADLGDDEFTMTFA